eukprot:4780543-Pyramimonas_sp.AAC.3
MPSGLKSGRGTIRSGLLERESTRSRHTSSSRFFANCSYAANVLLLVYLFVSQHHLLESKIVLRMISLFRQAYVVPIRICTRQVRGSPHECGGYSIEVNFYDRHRRSKLEVV